MEDEVGILIEPKKVPRFYLSVRFLSACLIFLGVAAQYMQKIDMSIGIVCMVNNTAQKQHQNSSDPKLFYKSIITDNDDDDNCLFKPKNGTNTDPDGPFDWSKPVQGIILTSYFYGYIITQVPSGWLSYKIGGRKVLGFSMFFGSLLTCLVPVTARWGYAVLSICRFATGVIHGAVWPAMSAMFVNWAPSLEKSSLIGFAAAGSWLGNVVALPLGSFLCVHGWDGGWPSIYYLFGIMGCTWFGIFMLLTTDSPDDHRFISKEEKEYLKETTQTNSNDTRNKKTPWLQIFTSKSCIAIFVSHFSCNWANYLFLTQLPSFMNDILRFDIKSNGFFSTLPYIACWLMTMLGAFVSDKIVGKNYITVQNSRKLFNTLGLGVSVLSTIGLIFVTCASPYLAVALLTIGLGFFGLCSGAGYIVNINEVGGMYSGILFGLSNTVGTIPGLIAPYIVGVITSNKLQSEWQIVFIISCIVYTLGGIFYLVFAESKPFYFAFDDKNSYPGVSIQTFEKDEDED